MNLGSPEDYSFAQKFFELDICDTREILFGFVFLILITGHYPSVLLDFLDT